MYPVQGARHGSACTVAGVVCVVSRSARTLPLTLADARDKAKDTLHEAGQGGDPAADKKAGRLAESVAELVESYLEKHAKTAQTKLA